MADHPKQQLGNWCRALASRTDPEVIFFLKPSPVVRAVNRRVPGEVPSLVERLGKVGRADEPIRVA